MANSKNVEVLNHPIVQHHLTLLRDKTTPPFLFRKTLAEITKFLCYEATRDLSMGKKPIETPMLKKIESPIVKEKLMIASIMRAGNGMLESAVEIFPNASVGHIGIYRDKFIHSTVEYFFKVPDTIKGSTTLLLDPLLATGDTAHAAIARLKEYGAGPIHFVSVLVAQQGIDRILTDFPETKIHCLSIEEGLDDQGYILPGLGDAGDRIYGTVPN